jgi:hypothetical protein
VKSCPAILASGTWKPTAPHPLHPPPPHSGNSQSAESLQPARKISKQQKDRLAQGYYERESMESLQSSRIKVLRDKQERQYQNALRRMERELDQLSKRNEENRQNLEKECLSQYQMTLAAFEMKRKRMQWRWSLEQAIERKKLELKTGEPHGPLPEITLPEIEETHDEVNALLQKQKRASLAT